MNRRKQTLISGVCIVGSLIFFSGCQRLYTLLDKEGAEEKELVGEVIPYETNPTVLEIQTLLDAYGYDPGEADGLLGLRTRDAIERFQKDQGLEASRFVDEETWKKLKVFKDNGFLVDGQLDIRKLQTVLKNAGFDPGAIDGKLGPKTKEAILIFQREHGLKIDGKVGYFTLTVLSQYGLKQ